jgi:hypothetical protein
MNKVAALAGLVASACAARDVRPTPNLTSPAQLCHDLRLGAHDFCMPAERLEEILRTHPLRVLMVKAPQAGIGGAKTMYLQFPDDHLVIKAKWKAATFGGEGLNNEPRKEIAAYELQKLFLDPDEYVVPPTVGRCIAAEFYSIEVARHESRPNFPDINCVFGAMSYWVENVKDLDGFSARRFAADTPYRERVALLNLFTHLIDHRDTRRSNFVAVQDERDPRMFSVDNGLALSGLRNPIAWLIQDWSHLLVTALPRRAVDRLRRLGRADLDVLLVVAEFHVHGGQLDPAPPGKPLDSERGVRIERGVLQLGLTRSEIDGIYRRMQQIVEKVDGHEIAVFEDGRPARRRAAR